MASPNSVCPWLSCATASSSCHRRPQRPLLFSARSTKPEPPVAKRHRGQPPEPGWTMPQLLCLLPFSLSSSSSLLFLISLSLCSFTGMTPCHLARPLPLLPGWPPLLPHTRVPRCRPPARSVSSYLLARSLTALLFERRSAPPCPRVLVVPRPPVPVRPATSSSLPEREPYRFRLPLPVPLLLVSPSSLTATSPNLFPCHGLAAPRPSCSVRRRLRKIRRGPAPRPRPCLQPRHRPSSSFTASTAAVLLARAKSVFEPSRSPGASPLRHQVPLLDPPSPVPPDLLAPPELQVPRRRTPSRARIRSSPPPAAAAASSLHRAVARPRLRPLTASTLRMGPAATRAKAQRLHPAGPARFGPISGNVAIVRIRSTTPVRLLHGFDLLPSGISGAGTGKATL